MHVKWHLSTRGATLLLAFATACGGNTDDATSADAEQDANSTDAEDAADAVSSPPEPEATEVGTPTADPVLATIGPEGGTLVSADGVLTLIVPADAVSEPTELGIQPITNNCFGGIGSGYRLTPEGTTFATPVELHFTYADEDLTGTVSEALVIAFQDADGFWQWEEDQVVDDANHEVSLSTDHLSDWALAPIWFILADDTSVVVGRSTGVLVLVCSTVYDNAGEIDFFIVSSCSTDEFSSLGVDSTSWAVNGVAGGDGSVGTLTNQSTEGATYTAPNAVPSQNPVAVSVKWRSTLLVANVTVTLDQWTGTSDVTTELGAENTRTETIHADVTWVWNPEQQAFAPQGTLTYNLTFAYPGAEGEDCLVSAVYVPDPDEEVAELTPVLQGGLSLIDSMNGEAQQYGGLGYATVPVTTTDSCTGSTTADQLVSWWLGFVPPEGSVESGRVEVIGGLEVIQQDIRVGTELTGGIRHTSYRFEHR